MHTIGLLILAAATAGDGYGYSKPNVGLKKLFRPHVVMHGPPPPGGMIGQNGAAGMGCAHGHPGCDGGPSCMGPGGPGGGPGGPGGPGAQAGRRFPNVRSQIYFLDPDTMKIGWQTGTGGPDRVYVPAQLTVPARYNFMQGYIYRLKLTDIPGRPGVQLYPTLEVAPSTPQTDAYLTHNPIPVQFTAEDFDQVVDGGNFVTKVIYLPDPKFQELAIAGVETLVSTRLEPGVDPILEADKRGTILLIVRVGAIDLEMPGSGSTVPSNVIGGVTTAPGTVLAPGSLPPGTLPSGIVSQPALENVPLEAAPVSPAPAPPPAPAPAPAPAPEPAAPPTDTVPPPGNP
ncbi:hypothetical protein SAMN05444166_0694 [Singulisphaera sp. GP187]|uniref:hypothetical protein n=1 Tax=Singulisphaera sp. GP187 TaxID=1882752 RepID=UPI000929C96E|nr:hypothetical protein [Singulisphaera sp. GP187]SIN76122.1 hypothetical protein SAMN05444166_0694 [Singulisphaera sp. GP187]